MAFNFKLVGELIRLRYKLLWARARQRNGRIALLIVGYLIFVLVAMLLAAGGLGAGLVALRTGKAQMVAGVVLGALFAELMLATVILGFGLNTIFSDLELRRYPVGSLERRVTRHLVALVDPFWFLGLALEFGLVFGFYVLGVGSLGLGLIAVLLLFVANYLAARVLAVFVDHLMANKIGSLVLMTLIFGVALGASRIPMLFKRNAAGAAEVMRFLRFTPPFGAAAAIAGTGRGSALGMAVLIVWLVAFGVAMVALERRPAQRRKLPTTAISFVSLYDRVGAWFGAQDAPLVAQWLRFYGRNNRFRTLSLIYLPMVGFLTYSMARPRGELDALFVAALGTFPLTGFICTGRFAVNQFGYVGGAFRRYILLPVDVGATLRTASYVSVMIGVSLVGLGLIAWLVLAPGHSDAQMLFMLAASGIAGLLVFNATGLWTSILGARRGNYNQNFGNDLSLAGNVVFMGGLIVCMVLPHVLAKLAPALVSPRDWWIGIISIVLGLLFYAYSLRATGALLLRHRERLMAVVEGRD